MEMNQKPGFSLIEILAVMVVIGILAAITFGMFKSSQENTRRRIAEADIALFKLKLNDFRLEEDGRSGAFVMFEDLDGDGSDQENSWETLEVALPLMLPTSLLSGVLFTLLGEGLHEDICPIDQPPEKVLSLL